MPLHREALRQEHVSAVDVARGAPARALRQKARPVHPQKNPKAAAPSKKGVARGRERSRERSSRSAHALWFMDEARFGQKGRTTHRWWMRGRAPAGRVRQAFRLRLHLCGGRPSTGEDFALVLPRVSSAAMSAFLAGFAETVPTTPTS